MLNKFCHKNTCDLFFFNATSIKELSQNLQLNSKKRSNINNNIIHDNLDLNDSNDKLSNNFKLSIIKEKYSFKNNELGKGAYGVVRLVKDTSTGHVYAMKTISKSLIKRVSCAAQLRNEIQIQMKLRHTNILRCLAHLDDGDSLHLIMECCSQGDLYSKLRRRPQRRMLEIEAFFYFFQLVNGLRYIHSEGYCHRDLKLENLLLTEHNILKIADFGWVTPILGYQKNYSFCGTLDYLAPETIYGTGHDWRVDLWAAGILLYELLVGRPPFEATRHYELITNILACRFAKPSLVSNDAYDVIKGFLTVDVNHRLTFEAMMEQPWIRRMWQLLCQKLSPIHYLKYLSSYQESDETQNNI